MRTSIERGEGGGVAGDGGGELQELLLVPVEYLQGGEATREGGDFGGGRVSVGARRRSVSLFFGGGGGETWVGAVLFKANQTYVAHGARSERSSRKGARSMLQRGSLARVLCAESCVRWGWGKNKNGRGGVAQSRSLAYASVQTTPARGFGKSQLCMTPSLLPSPQPLEAVWGARDHSQDNTPRGRKGKLSHLALTHTRTCWV